MKNEKKTIREAIDILCTFPMYLKHRKAMRRDTWRSKILFLEGIPENSKLECFAERLLEWLVKWSPLPNQEFCPSLDDRFDDFYGLALEDFHDMVLEISQGILNPYDISYDEHEVSTPRLLLSYVKKHIDG